MEAADLISDQNLLESDSSRANLINLYPDAMRLIANWLQPWDLISLSQTSSAWYRFVRRPEFRARISFPFKPKYKLTPEQFDCLKEMIENQNGRRQKLVYGHVGSGKTWVAAAYFMHRFQKVDRIAFLIVVPPTCVKQWSDFFRNYTLLPVISNYKSSCFYHIDWKKHADKFRIFITSNITSHTVQRILLDANRPHVIIHDEVHNGIGANYDQAVEVIGFTASIETFERRHSTNYWDVVKLKSETLRVNLPPVEFVCYASCGFDPVYKRDIAINLVNREIHQFNLKHVFDLMTYGDSRGIPFVVNRKTKLLKHGFPYDNRVDYFANQAIAIQRCMQIPKFRQLAAIAELVHNRGEKLIVFDTCQNYVVLIYLFLSHFGLKAYPFSTQYDPGSRARLLTEFAEEGDVLIGSVEMLSEGHNITCANNIMWMRYPTKSDTFMQGIGRCHRFPQKKPVYVHMISACEFELKLAMKAMEDGYSNVRRDEFEDEIAVLL